MPTLSSVDEDVVAAAPAPPLPSGVNTLGAAQAPQQQLQASPSPGASPGAATAAASPGADTATVPIARDSDRNQPWGDIASDESDTDSDDDVAWGIRTGATPILAGHGFAAMVEHAKKANASDAPAAPSLCSQGTGLTSLFGGDGGSNLPTPAPLGGTPDGSGGVPPPQQWLGYCPSSTAVGPSAAAPADDSDVANLNDVRDVDAALGASPGSEAHGDPAWAAWAQGTASSYDGGWGSHWSSSSTEHAGATPAWGVPPPPAAVPQPSLRKDRRMNRVAAHQALVKTGNIPPYADLEDSHAYKMGVNCPGEHCHRRNHIAASCSNVNGGPFCGKCCREYGGCSTHYAPRHAHG